MQSSTPSRKRPGKSKGVHPRDNQTTRLSKTLCYILRHGASNEGIPMRPDGYVRVKDLFASPRLAALDFPALESIVQKDEKQRFHLLFDPTLDGLSPQAEAWWIRANQGHSLKEITVDAKPILSASEIPMAVHGTNKTAWESISQQGLSRMHRNHIHFAQGLAGQNVISGMRKAANIFIYVDVQKAIDAGYKFLLSANGVVLTEGNEHGILPTDFFERVESRTGISLREPLPGWLNNSSDAPTSSSSRDDMLQNLE